VRLARDGVPVVIHDATLRRTGLRAGSVCRFTSEQLAEIDVGSWFNRANPKLARSEFSVERIPTLAQVFEFCASRRAIIYVEIKSEKDAAVELAYSVVELIKRLKFHRRVVVVSFDLNAVVVLRKLDPSIRSGALFGSARAGHQSWRTDTILAATADCGADEILLHRLLVRRRLVEKCIERNLQVGLWTVDEPKWLSRAQVLGIQALMTNNPRLLLTSIKRSVASSS